MDNLSETSNDSCCREDIFLYLEGELSSGKEALLEGHLLDCKECRDELNAQKNMMFFLGDAIESSGDVAPPADFAKILVANAESSVSGLSRPGEKSLALALSLIFLLLIVAPLGLGADKAVALARALFGGAQSLISVTAHFFYDVSLGLSVILRSLCWQASWPYLAIMALASALMLIAVVFILKQNKLRIG